MTVMWFFIFLVSQNLGAIYQPVHKAQKRYLNERNCHSKFYCNFSCQKKFSIEKIDEFIIFMLIENRGRQDLNPEPTQVRTIFIQELVGQTKCIENHIILNHRSLIYSLPTSTLFWLTLLNVLQTTYSVYQTIMDYLLRAQAEWNTTSVSFKFHTAKYFLWLYEKKKSYLQQIQYVEPYIVSLSFINTQN